MRYLIAVAPIVLALGAAPVAPGRAADDRAADDRPAATRAAKEGAGKIEAPAAPGEKLVAERRSQAGEAFGYRVGEERRYVLEPVASLRTGETAKWSIKLHDIDDEADPEGPAIVFDLAHERTELIRDMFGGAAGRSQTVVVEGRMVVNRFGFPLRLVMTERHDVSGEMGSASDVRTTTFVFDGRRYVKTVRIDGHEWEFNINVARHDDLDLEGRTGLFLFRPSSLRCLGRRSDIGRPRRCEEGDVAFANPGLLSLALPLLWEQQTNEKEILFFKPNGVGTLPGGLMDISRWARRERDQLGNLTRYFDRVKIEFEEFARDVEIGPRTVDAWRVDAGSAMREVFVDDDGTVLKVEIDAHPETYGSRWIRLLFPSEY